MSASVYQLRGPNTAAFSPYFGYNAAGVGYPGVGMGYGGVGVGCGDYEETYGSCAYETQHQQQYVRTEDFLRHPNNEHVASWRELGRGVLFEGGEVRKQVPCICQVGFVIRRPGFGLREI
ncbi:hypothetical protein M8J76_003109 [Diaphorina citri]|nr:hypothetical protein M8J76_003109 [Diaphorina citri]